MALLVTDLIQAVRDRLADNESVPIFDDTTLKRHLAQAVIEFSKYKPRRASTTVTILASPTTNYTMPDDCLLILEARDPDDAAFGAWTQDGEDLVVSENLIDTVASLTITYAATHVSSGSGSAETYATIHSVYQDDVVDLATARCLLAMSTDMAKRPTYGDTQVKVDHGDSSTLWQRQAYRLRSDVQVRLGGAASVAGLG